MKSPAPELYLAHILESIELASDIELVWAVVHEEFPKLATDVGATLARLQADN